ncbi:hypothetical protein BMW26_07875 [Microbacterium sp. 1.5R]|uniref:hypothetical protein n=1 Tax=Microbacterium sp. 1.5R TaxID=1916917 RepID=UPI00090CD361|nr:hypothetical protein [Microbacterium sp. 1.5R]APH44884.1 hypothetical protein BMW26_07875 [Microbacterium sp. 1.5R]
MTASTAARAEVREVFRSKKFGNIAGVIVTHGTFTRTDAVVLTRGDDYLASDLEVASLRRYADDLTEAEQGLEAGVGLGVWEDVQVGDVLYQRVGDVEAQA